MRAHALLAPLLLPLVAWADQDRIVIPDGVFLRFSNQAVNEPVCPAIDADADTPGALELAARAQAESRVSFSDEIDLVGHIEASGPDGLTVLGRRIEVEGAEIKGGGREALQKGTLLRVVGVGDPSGRVRAETLEVEPIGEPAQISRLQREVVKFEEKFWKKAKRSDDSALEAYLQNIADRLVPAYVQGGERRVRVMVVENPDLNAFALPNGTLVVHSGIIARMEDEAQMASILGHEIAHFTQRHAIRALQKETEQKLLGWGALLAEVALGATGKADAAKGIELMSSAWLSGYSRAHEDEADQVGLRYLYLAGYDVREAPLVWQTFQRLYGDPSEEANFFYGSHSTGRSREHNLSHEIWKAYEPSGMIGGALNRDAFLHATERCVRENALLDLKRGNLEWAEWGLHRALAANPGDAAAWVGLGHLALKQGQPRALETAIEAFRQAVSLDPDNPSAQKELGLALERHGERAEARAALEAYLALAPTGPDAEAVRRVLARI